MIKKTADRLFEWFCNPEYYDDIRGDLEQLYNEQLKHRPRRSADLYFAKEVALLFRLSLLRPFNFNRHIMIRNNLKIAFRQIRAQKLYSAIKIGGFALGIAAFLLLALYLRHELSYDNFHSNGDRIYRVTMHYQQEGFQGVDFPSPFARVIADEFAEVEQSGRLIRATWYNLFRPADRVQNSFEEGVAYADPELLHMFDLPMVKGEYAESMEQPNSILLSESTAQRIFPDEDPINQLLIANNDKDNPFKVVGVFADFPSNSHLDFNFLISMRGVEFWPGEQNYWGANMYDIYTLLAPGVDVEGLNQKLSRITTDYFVPSWIDRDFANPHEMAENLAYELQPVRDIYLDPADVRDGLPHGSRSQLWLFGFAGLLIIFIASINFINLSIARYSTRAREISMRKIIGATKKQIVNQFLSESIVFCFFSFIIGILLAWYTLPFVNQIAGKSLAFSWSLMDVLPWLIAAVLALGLLTGIYPAVYLSAIRVLSDNSLQVRQRRSTFSFRSLLVVFQFAVSTLLTICTVIVIQQMDFILNKDLGFDKEQVMIVKGVDLLGEKAEIFRDRAGQLADVSSVSLSDYLPVAGSRRYGDSFWPEGMQSTQAGVNAQIWQVDHSYIETLGMRLTAGRGFRKGMSSDSTSIVISRSLAEQLPIEQKIGATITNKEKSWQVIGIIEDFHFQSLKMAVTPACLVLGGGSSTASIKINAAGTAPLISSLENIWQDMSPNAEFHYEFLDESFAAMHQDVESSGQLFGIFALLALVIASLGLFGLTTFIAEQRYREIGIRKVLGASVPNIVGLLSSKLARLVMVAIAIAIPMGWYIMHNWLQNFAYRVTIDWRPFVAATCVTCLIALGTTGLQSLKAALVNPVDSIR